MKYHHKHKIKGEVPICPLTKKVALSEAQASRKLNLHNDIVRYYQCKSIEDGGCGGVHLTSTPAKKVLDEKNLEPKERNRLLNIRIQELEKEVEKLTMQLNELEQSNP